jgi:hypothetical protein
MAPTLVASRTALPPEGALRLRTGEAGSAARTEKSSFSDTSLITSLTNKT